MYIIYNLLMIGAFFLVMPYFIYRSICEKGFTRRMRQSLGGIRDEEIEAVALKGCIWIHGASVGEIVATSPLVKEIRKAMPEIPILVSAVTVGGYDMARQIIPEADAIIYFPLDLPFVSESVVKRIRPRIFMPVFFFQQFIGFGTWTAKYRQVSRLLDLLWGDAVRFIISQLFLASTVRLIDRKPHTICYFIRIHDYFPVYITGSTSCCLGQ